MLIINGRFGNVKFNGTDRVLESKANDEKEAAKLMDEVAKRWDFFEEHDFDEVGQKLKVLKEVKQKIRVLFNQQYYYEKGLQITASGKTVRSLQEMLDIIDPKLKPTTQTVGDLQPGDKIIEKDDLGERKLMRINEDVSDRIAKFVTESGQVITACKSTPCVKVEEEK